MPRQSGSCTRAIACAFCALMFPNGQRLYDLTTGGMPPPGEPELINRETPTRMFSLVCRIMLIG